VALTDNYHKVLTTTSTTRGYSYHPERHNVDISSPVGTAINFLRTLYNYFRALSG